MRPAANKEFLVLSLGLGSCWRRALERVITAAFPDKLCSTSVLHGHAGTKDTAKGTLETPEPT